mmetsp:Transcript_6413/g.23763  ORF Transcript_6413/g.23763 Transcript_6413/m.23763 type:complete len:234 (-) Transcript_6413:1945-2646(-)
MTSAPDSPYTCVTWLPENIQSSPAPPYITVARSPAKMQSQSSEPLITPSTATMSPKTNWQSNGHFSIHDEGVAPTMAMMFGTNGSVPGLSCSPASGGGDSAGLALLGGGPRLGALLSSSPPKIPANGPPLSLSWPGSEGAGVGMDSVALSVALSSVGRSSRLENIPPKMLPALASDDPGAPGIATGEGIDVPSTTPMSAGEGRAVSSPLSVDTSVSVPASALLVEVAVDSAMS